MDQLLSLLKDTTSSFSNQTASAIGSVLVAVLLLAVHRLSRRKPNPVVSLGFVGNLKALWSSGDVLSRYNSILREKMESEGVVRAWFGFWMYTLGDVAHTKQLATQPDIFQKMETGEFMPGSLSDVWLGNNMVSSNGETWRRYRRVLGPVFRRRWSPLVFEQCFDIMIKNWMSEAAHRVSDKEIRVEVHSWMQRLTLDVLGRAVLGYDFQALSNSKSEMLKHYTRVINASFSIPYFIFPWLDRWWNPFRFQDWRSLWALMALFDRIIEKKRAHLSTRSEDENSKDLLTLMLEATDEAGDTSSTLTNKELRDNTFMLLLAGHDTTATSLTAAAYLLAKYPEYQERLLEELDAILPNDRVPTLATKLPLIDAFIQETMRLYPAVQELPLRRVAEDVELKFTSSSKRIAEGRTTELIPKGSYIGLNILSVHRNPSVFTEPDRFYPERHLKSKLGSHDTSGFFAFSGGSRICIGMSFSLLEQRVVLSKLIRRFHIALPKDSEHRDELKYDGENLMMPRKVFLELTERSA